VQAGDAGTRSLAEHRQVAGGASNVPLVWLVLSHLRAASRPDSRGYCLRGTRQPRLAAGDRLPPGCSESRRFVDARLRPFGDLEPSR